MNKIKNFLRAKSFPYVLLMVIVLLHRALIFSYVYSDYEFLIEQNAGYITWQYLPISILKDHLLTGLLYLQQDPPLTQVILGVLLKLVGSMNALSVMLIGFQAIISGISTLFLYRLLIVFGVADVLALLVPIVFGLSADLLFMEYGCFGQLIYETLCMPLLLGLVFLVHRFLWKRKYKYLFFCGVIVALLALTRASFGYFLFPVLLYLLLIRVRLRGILVFLVPVLVLQGGWSIKNLLVYGYFSMPATTWTGLNLMRVVESAGREGDVEKLVSERSGFYPEWFVRLVNKEGYRAWFYFFYAPYVPHEIKKFDARISERLPENPDTNSLGIYRVSSYYKRAVMQYAMENPLIYAAGVLDSYKIFWRPIRDYTHIFTSLLYVEKPADEIWKKEGFLGFLRGDYEMGNEYTLLRLRGPIFLRNPIICPRDCRPLGMVVLPYAGMIAYILNVVAINFLGPLLVVVLLFRRRDFGFDRRIFCLLYLIYLYVAVVTSVGEHGENNRFRLAVEPVIWLLSVVIYRGWFRLFLHREPAVHQ